MTKKAIIVENIYPSFTLKYINKKDAIKVDRKIIRISLNEFECLNFRNEKNLNINLTPFSILLYLYQVIIFQLHSSLLHIILIKKVLCQ
ncbi:hypothetical protein BET04_08595 [Caminicella sporogenes]|nr:hypothetical protein BET04_08595 [Caminicella sporogenes]